VYIPQVTRCYKCQKFGHTSARCRKETDTCPVCAGPHKYTECSNRDDKKCANCGGSHSASYRECPKFLASKTLVQHAAVNRLSYRDALIQLRKQERTTKSQSVVVSQQAQTTEMSTLTQPTTSKSPGSKVDKDIQCNLDIVSPTVGDVRSTSADQVTPVTVDVGVGVDADATSDTKDNNKDTDFITHSDLFRLLAVLMQMSDDRSISRSTMIKAILNHVFNVINKPHEDIRQAISQYYSTDPVVGVESTAKTSDQENRKTNLSSKSKSDLKNNKGAKIDVSRCVQ